MDNPYEWLRLWCLIAYVVGWFLFLSKLSWSFRAFSLETEGHSDWGFTIPAWLGSWITVPLVMGLFAAFVIEGFVRRRREQRQWANSEAIDQWIARMEADESSSDWNRIAVNREPQPVDSTVSPEARALALAVLQNDHAAVLALVDWCLEQLQGPIGRHSVFYLDQCEKVLREIKGLLLKQPQQLDDEGEAYITLSREEVNRVYQSLFNLELLANGNGRSGPA